MFGSLKTGVILLAAASFGALLALPQGEDSTKLTFLAVGQGDCAVFQTGGRTVLIDVGPNVRGVDAGQRIVVPDLHRMGVESIDLVLLSHPDADHIGGLAAVLRAFPVGAIGISSSFRNVETLRRSLREAHADNVIWFGPGQRARMGGFTIQVDCPEWRPGEPDNGGSEFVKIEGEGATALLTGDADTGTESRMLAGHDWSAQVLKLGHHGSRTSSGPDWLRAVHPKWAVVSCGLNNLYGHPHPSVLDLVESLRIQVARTDREGDVCFVAGSQGFERSYP